MPHGLDTTVLGDLLKENYADPNVIKDQVNLNAKLWARFSDGTFLGGGHTSLGFIMAVRGEHTEGTTAINEYQALPDALYPQTRQVLVPPKIVVHKFQFSGLTQALAKGGSESFANAIDDKMSDSQKVFIKRMNQMSYGYGKGEIGTVNDAAVSAETTFTVDNAQHLRPGQYIDIYATLGGTKEVDGVKITNVNRATNLITVDSNVTCSDNAIIVVKGTNTNAPTDGKEFQGLAGIVDTTTHSATYLGLSRSSYTWWQGTVVDAGTTSITNDILQKTANRVMIFTDREAGTIVMHPNQQRKYLDLVLSQRRFNDGSLDAGSTGVTWNGKEIVLDADCPTNIVYIINFDTVKKYLTEGGIHISDIDGQTLARVDGFDAAAGYFKVYGNNASDYPAANAKIINLVDPGI